MLPLKINKFKHQTGQALLLVMLAMAVILTVVLSVSTKSVSDVSIGTYEEDALRAFSAAEAGIERALLTNQEYSTPQQVNPSDTSVTFTSDITSNPAGDTFVSQSTYNSGETATFWFAARGPSGIFDCTTIPCFRGNKFNDICWGINSYSTDAEKPAIMLAVYYDETLSYLSGDFSKIKVVRRAYDPYNARTSSNGFTAASTSSCTINDVDFKFKVSNLHFTSADLGVPCIVGGNTTNGCLIMARVRFFYNSASKPEKVGVDMNGPAGNVLPAQGNRIESIGVAGNSTRKINVFQSFAEPPSIFDAAVFSETSFSH